MGGTPRFDVYSVARPSILHRSTSGRSISLRVETSAQRLRLQFSRILRDNGILVEKHARLARKSTPKPIRRNPVEASPLRAAFTSKEVGLYVVSRLIRRFRWPREVHTVTGLRYETRCSRQRSQRAIESRREIWRCTRVRLVGNTISINVHGLYARKTKDRSIFDNSISRGATWSGRYRVRTGKHTPHNTGN